MKLAMMNAVPNKDNTEHARSVSSIAKSCQSVKDSLVATVADIVAHRVPRCHARQIGKTNSPKCRKNCVYRGFRRARDPKLKRYQVGLQEP